MSQKSLKSRFAQASEAGIYRLSATDRPALRKAASSLDFACFEIDLAGSADLAAILVVLGKALGFPEWYGANLDALNDCLTDFSWREAPGYTIMLSGADSTQGGAEAFAVLNEVFAAAIADWQDQGIPFWVVYEAGSSRRAHVLSDLPLLK